MTTGMLGAWGPAFARCVGFGGQARSSLFAASLSAEAQRATGGKARRWVVPDNVKELQLNILQTVV